MREVMAEYTEHFLLLRWTGLRGSDAADLRWSSVDFKNNEVVRITQKNKKKVYIPMHSELKECLTSLHEARKPRLSEHVLLRPIHNSSITRKTLYGMIVALGKRAEVEHAHPHRFRDTLAVDMLVKGATPYDVAKVLGDTVDMIEKHYTPFVPALRSRVHGILENGLGLEAR
jgi:integrase